MWFIKYILVFIVGALFSISVLSNVMYLLFMVRLVQLIWIVVRLRCTALVT